MGTKNARKCNNDVRACTLRSSTTGRRGTMGNRAPRQDGFRPVTAAWLGKRIGAEVRGQNGPIFDHFPIPSALTLDKCRQLGVLPCYALRERPWEASVLPVNYARSLFLIVLRND